MINITSMIWNDVTFFSYTCSWQDIAIFNGHKGFFRNDFVLKTGIIAKNKDEYIRVSGEIIEDLQGFIEAGIKGQ